MKWSDWCGFVFVLAVAAYAVGQSRQPDSFASRWSPVLTMPTEGLTIKRGPEKPPAGAIHPLPSTTAELSKSLAQN